MIEIFEDGAHLECAPSCFDSRAVSGATEANVPPLVTLLPIAAFRIAKLDPGTLRVFKRGCSRSIVFKV